MILTCKCKNAFQDKEYGTGRRVHNEIKDGRMRCTVCGDLKAKQGAVSKNSPMDKAE